MVTGRYRSRYRAIPKGLRGRERPGGSGLGFSDGWSLVTVGRDLPPPRWSGPASLSIRTHSGLLVPVHCRDRGRDLDEEKPPARVCRLRAPSRESPARHASVIAGGGGVTAGGPVRLAHRRGAGVRVPGSRPRADRVTALHWHWRRQVTVLSRIQLGPGGPGPGCCRRRLARTVQRLRLSRLQRCRCRCRRRRGRRTRTTM